MKGTTQAGHIDWPDLVAIVTRYLGPAPGRRGGSGSHWWRCPFPPHDDRNPSFQVKGQYWRCFGCGANGDAPAFVMKFCSLSFPDAKRLLLGDSPTTRPRPIVSPRPEEKPVQPPGPDWQAEAAAVIDDAKRRLWNNAGAAHRAYLEGRGLTEETIREADLGLSYGRTGGVPRGITIPWYAQGEPCFLQVRQPDGCEPKYMAKWGGRRTGFYPGRCPIAPGRPVIIVEGELDALLLGQELAGMAAVVTLGSASEKPRAADLELLLQAHPWYIATDADQAGDFAAACWPARRARRIRPPGTFKDWGEAFQRGVNLRRYWTEIFEGNPSPALKTWEELSMERWGPAVGDPTPGLIVE